MISKELRSDRSQLFAGCNERVAKVETLQKIIDQMSDERSNQSGYATLPVLYRSKMKPTLKKTFAVFSVLYMPAGVENYRGCRIKWN